VGYAASGDQLLTTSWDGTTRLWDPRSGRQLAEMPASPTTHTSSVSRDGRRFAVCNGRRMAIVQTERSPEYRTLYYRGEETAVSDLAIDPTSRLVVAGGLQGLRSWDLSTGSATGWFQVGPLFQIIFPGDGRELVTCGLMGVHRWPLSPGPSDGTLRAGPPASEPSLGIGWHTAALCQDGRLLAIVNAAQHEVVLFDTRAGTVKLRLSGQLNVRTAHISPDGRWIATGSQHGEDARVWSTDDGRVVCRVPHPAGTSSRVTFSPDGSRLLVSLGSEYVLLESGTWQVSRRFPRDYAGDMPGPAAFSPDCRLLTVTRTPQLVQLLDPDTGAEVATLLAPQASLLETLKFSADGNWLAAGSSAVHVWNLRRIRVHLATLGLDWGPGPPDGEPSHSPLPRLELVPGEMADVPRWITYYRWVLKSTPDNATACNNLAWSYATGPVPVRDLTAALKLAEKAVRLKPHRDYLNTLGVVYYRLGRYADAVTTFERAIGSTTEPVPAHDLFFLAMCFQQLGETEKARMTYQEALVAMERQPSYEEELRGFRAEAEQLIRP
jgi:WD40 repeat protein